MKKYFLLLLIPLMGLIMSNSGCNNERPQNQTAIQEQALTEINQSQLLINQPPPRITWSLERDNLSKRSLLQNDRAVMFFMYVFIEGVAQPIGYYQVNKVSSVNSQLTNTEQIISGKERNNLPLETAVAIPSPAEDGSYGTNGDGVFGFTPEDIYIETNMKYITATVPLHFATEVTKLAIINTDEARKMLDISKKAMSKK